MNPETSPATVEQPAPRAGAGEDCWLLAIERFRRIAGAPKGGSRWPELSGPIVADMRARRELGIARYGKPVRADNGRDHLADAYQELLDALPYLEAEIQARGGDDPFLSQTSTTVLDALSRCKRSLEDRRVDRQTPARP